MDLRKLCSKTKYAFSVDPLWCNAFKPQLGKTYQINNVYSLQLPAAKLERRGKLSMV
jgi:hypothetical protein